MFIQNFRYSNIYAWCTYKKGGKQKKQACFGYIDDIYLPENK